MSFFVILLSLVSCLFGFVCMGAMNFGLEAFFDIKKLQERPLIGKSIKIMILILACVFLILGSVALFVDIHYSGFFHTNFFYFYIFYIPLFIGVLPWGLDALGLKKGANTIMGLLRFFTFFASILFFGFVGVLAILFLKLGANVIFVASLIFLVGLCMLPAAFSWGLEAFGYILLKPKFFAVKLFKFFAAILGVIIFLFFLRICIVTLTPPMVWRPDLKKWSPQLWNEQPVSKKNWL